MRLNRFNSAAFTLVELLVVIVVIGIISSITTVVYRGVQDRAKTTALMSELSKSGDAVSVYIAQKGTTPSNLAAVQVADKGSITYQYTAISSDSYCITGLYNNALPYNITGDKPPAPGPCSGHTGGPTYCPNNSYVPVNGYHCDGVENGIASLNTSNVKLAANASNVPPGAPGAYVGRQTARDNYLSDSFTVAAGEVYCVEGWVATQSSEVRHAIGLFVSTGSSNNWMAAGYQYPPAGTWSKISGCVTVPTGGYVSARVWSQNDGSPGGNADVAWYQTAIKFTKQ